MSERLSPFAEAIFKRSYAFTPDETWEGCAKRVAKFVAGDKEELVDEFEEAIALRKFIPGGRYLYSSGREISQLNNCFIFLCKDSREGWAELLEKHVLVLSTGGGAGTNYSKVRASGEPIKRFGGYSSGPLSLMYMVNEVARHVMAGGVRRSALWAGLNWKHGDIEEFIKAKNWATNIQALKESDFNFPAPLDMTNISVGLDDEFFSRVHKDQDVWDLYYKTCKNMCKTGEPGFSIDTGANSEDIGRNPCCEVTSKYNNDCCNLGSINLSRIKDVEELKAITRLAVRFLYLGSYRSWLPHADIYKVKDETRRIGLGIMGLHEWCLQRGLNYEPSGELGKWLSAWSNISDDEAKKFAPQMGGNIPVAVRAIAPNGTTSIVAETSSGIEPLFCVAYKRRFLGTNGKWNYSYVIDPTAERIVTDKGVDPNSIEDSISLSKNVERRIQMQAFVQDFVDQGISSTINIPEWGEEGNNNAKRFAEILLRYLPRLRGITVYPDGARAGQPLTKVKYETAKSKKDVVFVEDEDRCKGGTVCGL